MSHFAKVENGLVTQVIVAEEDFISTGALGDPANWKQTSYNTHANQHPENKPLRGNYAGVGYTYDAQHDVFYPPKPYPSWSLDQATWTWKAPTPYPTDNKPYSWNETTKTWVEIV
jgi:hypothetical protein